MPHIREIILAGLVGEVKEYHTYKYQSKNEQRGGKREVSSAEMALINEYNAARKLRIILNANFKADDFYLTLTYKDITPDAKQAKEYFKKFIRKLRDFYKSIGLPLKYIGTTEYKGKRIHHHLLINAAVVGKSQIQKFWAHGFIKKEDFGGHPDDCQRLADYFIKESKNTFKTESRVHGLRWISSKKLIHPEPEKKIIKADTWREEPKPKKGYYIDKNSIEEWVTRDGYHCRFYRMLKMEGINEHEKLDSKHKEKTNRRYHITKKINQKATNAAKPSKNKAVTETARNRGKVKKCI